ncbi:lysophospholipid acyltransferase family protein [Treponema sp.]
MTEYYPGDSYETPDKVPRALREYLMLGSRWSPYTLFFQIILTYRKHALKGTYDDEIWSKSSYETMKYLESCGAKFKISGMDKIRALQGPAVFVSNHMSTLETTALPGLICPIRPVTYVVKEKLSKGRIWGPIMRSRDPIVVGRKDPRADLETVLNGGMDRLGRGISIIIFPQGTRTDIFDRTRFNSLGVKLAARAGVPVVPVAVKTDFWGNSPIFRGFGPVHRERMVHIEFGDPIRVEGRGKAEHEKTLDFIESRLRQWGAPLAEGPREA